MATFPFGSTTGTDPWSSSHWPAFPSTWFGQGVFENPLASIGVDHELPESSENESMIGDSLYVCCDLSKRKRDQVTYTRPLCGPPVLSTVMYSLSLRTEQLCAEGQ